MSAPIIASPLHHYDTRTHGIACGVRGADHRSTKHSRAVTCGACLELLGRRATPPPAASAPDAVTGSAR